MAKQKQIKIIGSFGWITVVKYRKSMDDIVIKQYRECEPRIEREICIDDKNINKFIEFINSIERKN